MFVIHKLAAVFAVAAEDFFQPDMPSADRQSYRSLRKLGLALERLESLSPPINMKWKHPHEGSKEYADWAVTDVLREQIPAHDLQQKKGQMDTLGMILTLIVLAEAARNSETSYRAEKNAWPVIRSLTYLQDNLDKVEALADTLNTLDLAAIDTIKTRNRDALQSRGCVPLPDAPAPQKIFGREFPK